VIVGGGPAGLAAALWLARYRRTVRVIDAGPARNQPAWAVHGYPGLADPAPAELRTTLRDQAVRAGAAVAGGEVLAVGGEKGGFTVLTDQDAFTAARVILAYGLRDYIPAIPGVDELYGRAVFHCPDCDGPGITGRRVGVIGWDRAGANLALYLLNWTDHVTLLAHGSRLELSARARRILARNGIIVCTDVIERALAERGRLCGVASRDGRLIELDALFFHLGTEPRCAVAAELGCRLDAEGYIDVDRGQETSVPGVHAAGDITGHPHLVVAAAAEGVRAALSIHRSLLPESRHL
jgi:thioredoxin reductase